MVKKPERLTTRPLDWLITISEQARRKCLRRQITCTQRLTCCRSRTRSMPRLKGSYIEKDLEVLVYQAIRQRGR